MIHRYTLRKRLKRRHCDACGSDRTCAVFETATGTPACQQFVLCLQCTNRALAQLLSRYRPQAAS